MQIFHQNCYVYGQLRLSNIIINNDCAKPKISLINCNEMVNTNKVDTKTDLCPEKIKNNKILQIKKGKFSSTQILKNERIDYKTDLESLFYILYYLANNGKHISPTLFEKKLLMDQITLSIHKEKLIEKLGSKIVFIIDLF